jgi:hypothetical protein
VGPGFANDGGADSADERSDFVLQNDGTEDAKRGLMAMNAMKPQRRYKIAWGGPLYNMRRFKYFVHVPSRKPSLRTEAQRSKRGCFALDLNSPSQVQTSCASLPFAFGGAGGAGLAAEAGSHSLHGQAGESADMPRNGESLNESQYEGYWFFHLRRCLGSVGKSDRPRCPVVT